MFDSPAELDEFLSRPSPGLVDWFSRLDGDLVVLGVGGKMGVTLAMLAARASAAAGGRTTVTGVSRFGDPDARRALEEAGVRTIAGDLIDRTAVAALPDAANVVFMAGRKFGTRGEEPATWAANTVVPANVAERFRDSRIVAFSTGCVYPLVTPDSGGCDESVPPAPVGEYAQSCLGRERVFEFFSARHGTPVCLLRLNYAIDLRYGVLHDLATAIAEGRPVDLSSTHFNCLWQGDANERALRALGQCACPAVALNLTGAETLATREVALRLARAMGADVAFDGSGGGPTYLNDASRSIRLFGRPAVTIDDMIAWTAEWVSAGRPSLGKPTHFEVRNGDF